MSAPTLATKLYIPPPRSKVVKRSRLIERLNEGLRSGCKLTLISAQAGFGKTTLVSEWVAGCGRPVAWLSLDEGDHDSTRFLTYFVTALQKLALTPNVGEEVLRLLQSHQPPPIESILTTLLNEITSIPDNPSTGPFGQSGQCFIFVLDDYHLLNSKAVDHVLAFLLEHQPPQMRMVITTREDPNLPLARLRVRGQLTELRIADLRFTPSEAGEFLNQVMGLNLSATDIAALENRTEGWVAGLQLAALSMQGQQNVSDFIRAFSGSNRYVLDYLTEEVFNRQPAEIQSFLLQTSILDRMSADLCDAILENKNLNSQAVLEQLERDNLFVIALDPNRQWYRYHHLFAESLRSHLLKMSADDLMIGIAELHRRASDWFEHNGSLEEAIQHTLAAEDFSRALRLITQAAPVLFPRAEFKTLFDWVAQLPEDQVRANHELMTYLGWMWLFTGQSEKLAEFISATQKAQNNETSPDSRGRLLGLQSMLAFSNEQIYESLAFGREALPLLKSEDHFLRGIVLSNFSRAQVYAGELDGAVQTLQEAIDLSERTGFRPATVTLLVNLAMVIDLMGQRRKAITLCQRALDLSRDARGQLSFIATTPYIGLSWLAYEANELEEARENIYQAENFLKLLDPAPVRHSVLQIRFLLDLAQQGQAGAFEVIQEAHKFVERVGLNNYLSVWMSLEAELRLRDGNLAQAARWANTIDIQLAAIKAVSFVIPQRDTTFFTYIHVLLAQKKWEEAHSLLTDLERVAQETDRNGPLISLFLMHAHARWEQGQPGDAIHFLEQAVKIAAPEGLIRPFLDEAGPYMTALPRARLIAPAFVDTLLSALGEISLPRPDLFTSVSRQTPLVEPISDREFEVLQLIAQGYTNQEIARKLIVEVSTVKKHINNIFGKLGVTHRAQAVARGRELGIL